MTTTTITVGWTQHHLVRNRPAYTPFLDTYQDGMPQHTETIEIELPDVLDHPYEISPERVAEWCFTASNAPDPAGITAQIRDAIAATGYNGAQAHFSLSIGDTVTVGGVRLACTRTGWERV